MRILNFEKDPDGKWYVVFPDYPGPRADLEMVLGADMMLDIYAQGEGNVSLTVSETEVAGFDVINLVELCDETTGGAYYKVSIINNIDYDFRIWLCDVTKFVFGYFPEFLYLKECGI